MSIDAVNALFILIGAAMTFLSVYRLYKDKQVRGVHPAPTIFFASWGMWNLYYFPSLGQWFSLTAEVLLISMNVAWLWLYWRYRRT